MVKPIRSKTTKRVILDDLHGLYREKWRDLIVPDATAHPAKFARALIRRIYQHAVDECWLAAGDSVVDCFGGVALGAHDAMRHGLHWTGVELEIRFVDLGNQNIELWNERFAGRLPQWGSARLIQGDSRNLAAVLAQGQAAIISSPPYGNETVNDRNGIRHDLIKSRYGKNSQAVQMSGYSVEASNLGNLREGDFSAVITSPPFVESLASDEPEKRGGLFKDAKRKNDRTLTATYGESAGQLGTMKAGALVTSPPYETCPARNNRRFDECKIDAAKASGATAKRADWGGNRRASSNRYNIENPGQLGNSTGDTFWSASRLILEQSHSILAPGAHAIFVVKDFVRNKKIVPFCEQWAELCEKVGFKLVHIHRSWLIERKGAQYRLDGGEDDLSIQRKSFFRLLAERKGSPKIDFETILCFERI